MKTICVSNRAARAYVQGRRKFRGSNTCGEWNTRGTAFVVWSYRAPIYLWAEGIWFGNSTKFSRTTSRHQSQLHPLEEVVPLPDCHMHALVDQAYFSDEPMAEIVAKYLTASLPTA